MAVFLLSAQAKSTGGRDGHIETMGSEAGIRPDLMALGSYRAACLYLCIGLAQAPRWAHRAPPPAAP